MSTQKYAIIVAGGKGKRMGKDIPKQFIEVAGMPILMHTIKRFYDFSNNIKIILVLPELQQDYWKELVEEYAFPIPHKIVSGGKERFHSVLNGLNTITEDSLIAIHDGVRPLVSLHTIKKAFHSAKEFGSAIPIIDATESIRKVKESESKSVDRSKYKMVQTPQIFKYEILKKAYAQDFSTEFTDDASVVEATGHKINLVEGNSENIKITRPMDLVIANSLLKQNIIH